MKKRVIGRMRHGIGDKRRYIKDLACVSRSVECVINLSSYKSMTYGKQFHNG